jgi:DNA-directed RNA polymerase specialized sigma24 family protein
MTQTQYEKYRTTILKICGNDEKAEDLLHDILLQLSSNTTYNSLDDKSKLFFFVRTVQNQYWSNNSKFQRTYKKYIFEQLPVNYDPKTEEYKERPTMDWIEETLDQELNDNPERWYEVGIFRLYLQHRKLEPIHRQTQIPKYSLRQTLKDMKEWINNKWITYNGKEKNY